MTSPGKLTIVLLVATPGTTWGGMEQHTADLAGALAVRGHSVHVLGHKTYRDKFPAGVQFHPLPVQLGRRNLWLQLALRRRLRELSPDILHAQGNKAAQLAGKTGKLARVRIGTVHGTKSSHKAFDRLDEIVAVSPRILGSLRHPHKHLIYNGVDSERPRIPANDGPELPAGVTNVIAVGRLEPVKGFDALIRAWAILGPSADDCHLTIFGEGSQREQLARLIQQSGLGESVTLAGFSRNLAPVYCKAELAVISSEREGFPYVLAESLIYGCPVVSTPVSGPRDLLPPSSLSAGHNDRDLADLMARALANLEALKQSQRSAMAFARETLTLKAMAEQTEALYRKAITERRATGK
ncbi:MULTISPECIES: glycosyltransferase [unclassified Marinobacter]|jgi:glycosyltransferase involved in cell wall biosynthesis|uniref:glycosyltransferase n=1 Tax=unclassified Marinobacter TaxID=83889 RepID=UPI00192764E0|nr:MULTISPECIES: glycosyltransferase [unclassified Marinobacter]MBL3826318.1 glycosyltransferase [Marinobacter sp. MC3]MBL3894824.1 glycosyltransferase [Marinobacter sp. MW3]